MKFAFLVHPLSNESKALLQMNDGGLLSENWGGDLLRFCNFLHTTMAARRAAQRAGRQPLVRVIDQFNNLRSATGARVDGRLYEIPMGAAEIFDSPGRAVEYMEQAAGLAAEWGAAILGLGSMTGIVGSHGTFLAEQSSIPVTTGNSLTVFAALQNLRHACLEADIELAGEVVAVVGIPGSIASAAAKLLAPLAGRLLLVARRDTLSSRQLAESLKAELLLDVSAALKRARVVFSATSRGNCIDQHLLRPGSIVIDVGVPADVQGSVPIRKDALIISGGLTLVPESFPRDSTYLGFHHGVIPSCLGETINLALENCAECFSLGRNLSIDRVKQIGAVAVKHGFKFDRLYSFGLPLEATRLAEYHKALSRRTLAAGKSPATADEAVRRTQHDRSDDNGECRTEPAASPAFAELATPAELGRAAQLYERYVNPVLLAIGGSNGFTKTFTRGAGNYLWDEQGNRYVDFLAGFGSANLGHNHPRIVEEVARAMGDQAPGFAQSSINPLAARLAEALVAVAPDGLEMVFFCNSGSEAVEAALKLARLSSGRSGLLHCDRSFHGKTFGALSVTGNPRYQQPFAPLLPDCESVPFADLEALERQLATRKYACFIVEPIQAEAGIYVPSPDYLPEAQRLCRKYGTLLVVDEVQTGIGRTGSLFAVDALGVQPDIMTLAKSLGGGLVPIGATLARRDLWLKAYGSVDRFALHTSTFGGGSLACAAALATLRVLREDGLLDRCRSRGRRMLAGLRKLVQRYKHDPLEEVRGDGLLIGLEFSAVLPSIAAHYRASDATGLLKFVMPDLDGLIRTVPTLYAVQSLLNAYGIYAQVARSNPFVLRIQPPLTIEERHIDHLLGSLDTIAADLRDCAAVVDNMISKSIVGILEPDPTKPPAAAQCVAHPERSAQRPPPAPSSAGSGGRQ